MLENTPGAPIPPGGNQKIQPKKETKIFDDDGKIIKAFDKDGIEINKVGTESVASATSLENLEIEVVESTEVEEAGKELKEAKPEGLWAKLTGKRKRREKQQRLEAKARELEALERQIAEVEEVLDFLGKEEEKHQTYLKQAQEDEVRETEAFERDTISSLMSGPKGHLIKERDYASRQLEIISAPSYNGRAGKEEQEQYSARIIQLQRMIATLEALEKEQE